MPGNVLTIGNFDGVHIGHRAILRRCRELAGPDGHVIVVTFEPPPVAVLQPSAMPPRILKPQEKRARLLTLADAVVVLEPTPQLLGQTAEEFIAWLVREQRPSAIVEGPDFRCGKDRRGDIAMLRELGKLHRFQVHVQESVDVELSDQTLVPASSSLVRWLVGRGRVLDASRCLAAPFALTGKVVRGEQRGRTIDVPTANLDPAAYDGCIVPADGVYAGFGVVRGGGRHMAAISVGTKPTFGHRQLTVEAHLLDYEPEPFEALYGQTITLTFERWLRDQYTYPDLPSLLAQIAVDLGDTRRVLAAGDANVPIGTA